MSNQAHKRDLKNPMMNRPELFQFPQVFETMGTIWAIIWKPGLGERPRSDRAWRQWSFVQSRVVQNTINLSRDKCTFLIEFN